MASPYSSTRQGHFRPPRLLLSLLLTLARTYRGGTGRTALPPDSGRSATLSHSRHDPGSVEATSLGASEPASTVAAPVEALHTFTLVSVVARASTVLPCPAAPFGSLASLHLPPFTTNLVGNAVLQEQFVTVNTPRGELVAICTDSRTGAHLATFTQRPGSVLYTLTTESAQVAVSGQLFASCSYWLLTHQNLLWHHRLGHPTLLRLQGMHSHLPGPCPRSHACLRRHAFPASMGGNAPLLTPRYRQQLLLCRLSTWACGAQPASVDRTRSATSSWLLTTTRTTPQSSSCGVPQLHSDRRSEFSSSLLEGFCRAEGIAQSFTLSASPQQNGIAERGIGLIMEVARTSMIHAAAPHFLWPFAVRYAAHQLNLWPRVSVLETSPTLRWTGEVGDASAFRVPAPTPALACAAVPSLRRGVVMRRSSLLLVSADHCSSADSPNGRANVPGVFIPWITTVCRQLRARFHLDLQVLQLHSDRGGEFSSGLLEGFCRAEGIAQSFTLPASSHQNGIAEHGIGLIIEVARTSMIHADAPHFLWPFAVRYATHQLNLWPRVSVPETLPTLRWTGEVGDASAFRVWGVLSLVHDTTAGKLSLRTLCCIFLGFPTDSPPGSLTTLPRAGSCPQRTSLLTSRSASTVSTRMRLLLSPDRRSTWSLVPPK
ncbi:unnamed protein product [Closterium sp. NIES-53]